MRVVDGRVLDAPLRRGSLVYVYDAGAELRSTAGFASEILRALPIFLVGSATYESWPCGIARRIPIPSTPSAARVVDGA